MRYKGFVGSFSTSALLVTAAVSILLIVSAIVAFEGWPGPTGDTPTETFLLERSSGGGDPRPAPELVLEPPATGERATASDSAAGGTGPDDTAAESSVAGLAPPSGQEPLSPAGGAVAPPADPAAPRPGTGGAPTVGDPSGGGTLGGTVDRASGVLDEGAEGLTPVTDEVEGLVGGSIDSVKNPLGGR